MVDKAVFYERPQPHQCCQKVSRITGTTVDQAGKRRRNSASSDGRLRCKALSLHPAKTRLIEFGRFAAKIEPAVGWVNRVRSTSLSLLTSQPVTRRPPAQPADAPGPDAGKVASYQRGVEAAHAQIDPGTEKVAGTTRPRILLVSSNTDERQMPRSFPALCG